jgi:alpha-D-ribose 1-methylphosphonate 5-triphosphate diphosphatase
MAHEATPRQTPTRLPDRVLANARLVLPGEMVTGSLAIRDGLIAAIDTGAGVPRGAEDCDGDLVAPGLVELHTDNLERHLEPRPGVAWPRTPAVLAHDAELAGCGITTVFDALRVGSLRPRKRSRHGRKYARELAHAIGDLHRAGALRIRHRLHLRAELCSESLAEELAEFRPEDRIGIVSLMDHTPGQRQFTELTTLRRFAQDRDGLDDAEFADHIAYLKTLSARNVARHEAVALTEARRLGAVIASHDDTTPAHVAASAAAGARLAEFPTTAEAAAACRAHGIAVMMGAPNLIRGGSHSGNVAAAELADAGLLDILSSDYAPASLLQAALHLGDVLGDLARGLATVTDAPARAAALTDRGRIEPGRLADLVRIRRHEGVPILRGVWVGGARVA